MAVFNIQIEVGNASMAAPEDVADALRVLANRIDDTNEFDGGVIRDDNGNKVGFYAYNGENA